MADMYRLYLSVELIKETISNNKWANALVPPTPSLKGGLGVAMVHGWPP